MHLNLNATDPPPAAAAARQSAVPRDAAAPWMSVVLGLAAAYNILWGAFAILFPLTDFRWAGMAPPNYPSLWQCLGMIVGVYGVGYAMAARDPLRHWPIVLVGLLGKIFGPLGFVFAVVNGELPAIAGLTILTNDLAWWVPFYLIVRAGMRFDAQWNHVRPAEPSLRTALAAARTSQGESLLDASRRNPLLVVLLRHSGCTFCREALSDLARQRRSIEASGTQPVVVMMSAPAALPIILGRYGLNDLTWVGDADRVLYRAFGLQRGSLWQLFGPRVWWRGVFAGLLHGHGVGPLDGDGLQMPGVFLVYHGEVIRSYRHASAADRPDYAALARLAPAGHNGAAAHPPTRTSA